MMILKRKPSILVGAGTGGRTALWKALELNEHFDVIADRNDKKLHETQVKELLRKMRIKNAASTAGEAIVPVETGGRTLAIIDNLGSLPRIFQAMESAKHKGIAATLVPVTNRVKSIALIESYHPDGKRAKQPHPLISVIAKFPFGRNFIGVRHSDGGFFNPISGRVNPPEYLPPIRETREGVLEYALEDWGNSNTSLGPHQIAVIERDGKPHVYSVIPQIYEDINDAIKMGKYYGSVAVTKDGEIVIPSQEKLEVLEIKPSEPIITSQPTLQEEIFTVTD